jgi:hypothetical protein
LQYGAQKARLRGGAPIECIGRAGPGRRGCYRPGDESLASRYRDARMSACWQRDRRLR